MEGEREWCWWGRLCTGCFALGTVEQEHALVEAVLVQVRVAHRHLDILVPEQLLHREHGGPAADELAREAVSERVPADGLDAGETAGLGEVPAGGLVVDDLPVVREEEALTVGEGVERRPGLRREAEVPDAVVLRAVEDALHAPAADGDPAGGEVHVGPVEGDELGEAHAGVGRDGDHRPPRLGGEGDDDVDLVRAQEAEGLRRHPERADARDLQGDVPLGRGREAAAEDHHVVVDGLRREATFELGRDEAVHRDGVDLVEGELTERRDQVRAEHGLLVDPLAQLVLRAHVLVHPSHRELGEGGHGRRRGALVERVEVAVSRELEPELLLVLGGPDARVEGAASAVADAAPAEVDPPRALDLRHRHRSELLASVRCVASQRSTSSRRRRMRRRMRYAGNTRLATRRYTESIVTPSVRASSRGETKDASPGGSVEVSVIGSGCEGATRCVGAVVGAAAGTCSFSIGVGDALANRGREAGRYPPPCHPPADENQSRRVRLHPHLWIALRWTRLVAGALVRG